MWKLVTWGGLGAAGLTLVGIGASGLGLSHGLAGVSLMLGIVCLLACAILAVLGRNDPHPAALDVVRHLADTIGRLAAPASPATKISALYVECSMGKLPKYITGEGKIIVHMMDVHHNGFGFTRKTRSYSEREKPEIDWGEHGSEVVAKCIVTNYGKEPLTDIALVVDAEVRAVKRSPGSTQSGAVLMAATLRLRVDKIDPGEDRSATFYILNTSSFYIWLLLKDAEAKPIGADGLTRVPVDTNLIARHIALFPNDRGNLWKRPTIDSTPS